MDASEVLTAGFWICAIAHAAVHVGEHEALQLFKVRIGKALLHNHDVQRALAESTEVALRIIQDKYKANCPDKRSLKQAKRVFDDLCNRSRGLFAICSDYDQDLIVPLDTDHASQMTTILLTLSSDIPADIQALIKEHFAASFVYAFKELGLKRDQHVRTVITNQLLLGLTDGVRDVRAGLGRLDEVLEQNSQILRFEQDFREYVGERFNDFVTRVETVQRVQHQLLVALSENGPVAQRPLGILCLSTLEGFRILMVNLTGREITVGRHPDNGVLLPDPKVSSRHAIMRFRDNGLFIRDLASKNGTLLNGRPLQGEHEFTFGDEITIGSYVLEVARVEEKDLDQVSATI